LKTPAEKSIKSDTLAFHLGFQSEALKDSYNIFEFLQFENTSNKNCVESYHRISGHTVLWLRKEVNIIVYFHTFKVVYYRRRETSCSA
jgi:hypothetical protein